MVLFVVSFLLIFLSSYFITAPIKENKCDFNIFYFFLIFISEIVLTTEILSLFHSIEPNNFIILNVILCLLSFIVWLYFKKPLIEIKPLDFFKELKKALRNDKKNQVLLFFFLCSLLATLFVTLFAPSNLGDDLCYHFARISFWLQNHTLNHYPTTELRQLIFPMNSEIVMMWPMLFLKNDILAKVLFFNTYLLIIFSLYSFLKYLKISPQRALWTCLIASSIPAVLIEASSAQINSLLGLLFFISIYLFIYSVKENKTVPIIFSALSYALAVGTKTTALFFSPIFFIYIVAVGFWFKKDYLKKILYFAAACIPFMLLFASYNYISNYFTFGNPLGAESYMAVHKFHGGFNEFVANIMRYFFLLIDFSGIPFGFVFVNIILPLKIFLLKILGVSFIKDDYLISNNVITEFGSLFGVIGFLFLLPASIILPFKVLKSKNPRTKMVCLLGIFLTGVILLLSIFFNYIADTNRYLITAIVICLPILIYTYSGKLKFGNFLIMFVAICCFVFVPITNVSRPFIHIVLAYMTNTASEARYMIRNINTFFPTTTFYKKYLFDYAKDEIPANATLGLALSADDNIYNFFTLNKNFKIHMIKSAELKNGLKDYDFVITDKAESDTCYMYRDGSEMEKLIYFDNNKPLIMKRKPFFLKSEIDLKDIEKKYVLVKTFEDIYVFKKK